MVRLKMGEARREFCVGLSRGCGNAGCTVEWAWPILSQMLRVSSVGPCWCSADYGGVFACPTPQPAEFVAELFATKRDRFGPLYLQFICTLEGVFLFD